MDKAFQNILLKDISSAFASIGYNRNLIKYDYEFANFTGNDANEILSIDLAVFGQEPLDYRSACFGVLLPTAAVSDKNMYRSLGAPVIFFVKNGHIETWINKGTRLERVHKIPTENITEYIKDNKDTWNPDVVIRKKSGFTEAPSQQLDLIDVGLLPILDREASEKIDNLIRRLLHRVEEILHKKRLKINTEIVFKLVFNFLTSKVLADKNIVDIFDHQKSDPDELLNIVLNYYGDQNKVELHQFPSDLIEYIHDEIINLFSFKNLSVDTLTYIYENTFVSTETRKALGIHSTPSYLSDYMMSLIPFEDIHHNKWNVVDPMAGHGILLIGAMRRMKYLLPKSWSTRKRHNFFIKRIHGIEIDPFSVEVAKMCLTLADFPEPDGWNIINDDVFRSKQFDKLIKKATIVVGNPPFEYLKNVKPETPKPKELLKLLLHKMTKNSLLGLILPRAFLDGTDYRKEREYLLKNFNIVNVTKLPDRIFNYSDAETSIIIAKKSNERKKTFYRIVREVDRERFKSRKDIPLSEFIDQEYFIKERNYNLVFPYLSELWEYLKYNESLGKIADIKTGVQFAPSIPEEQIYSEKPFKNGTKGLMQVISGYMQYCIIDKKMHYISTNPKLRRFSNSLAWIYPWDKEKIILPTSRLSRNPWKYAAVIDRNGLLLNRRFFGLWLKDISVTLEFIAAILNSPISQAYCYDFSHQWDIRKKEYDSIPLPKYTYEDVFYISNLVNQYIALVEKKVDDEILKETILKIDAEVLKLYDLPPRLERKLLDYFWGEKRRVPFDFYGYIPPEIESWIPLHVYLSENYKNSNVKNILENIPIVEDKEVIEILKGI